MSNWHRRLIILALIAAVAGCGDSTKTEPSHFTVTPSGDDHTQVLPEGPQRIEEGGRQTFELTTSAGYRLIDDVAGTCPPGSWRGSSYTTGAIEADCTVQFHSESEPHGTFVVSASGDEYIKVEPRELLVEDGGAASFNVTATAGHGLASEVGGSCPAGAWSDGIYTTGPIASDCTVEFSSEQLLHAVMASGDDHLDVTPLGEQLVAEGETITFTVIAASGYQVSEDVRSSCPEGAWSGASYSTGPIVSSCTIDFVSQRILHTVTASDDGGVTVSPTGEQQIGEGDVATFSLVLADGHRPATPVGGTCPAGELSGTSYSTGAIFSDCTVVFTSERIPEGWATVSFIDDFGLLLGSAPIEVAAGDSLRLPVASTPYRPFLEVAGTCPAGSWHDGEYSTGPILSDCEIIVSPKTLTLPHRDPSYFSIAAAFPTTTGHRVEGLPLAGRLLVATGQALFLWQDHGGDSWIPVAELTEPMDPGFLAISPDGERIAVGAGYGQPVYILPTKRLSASHPPVLSRTSGVQWYEADYYSGAFYDDRYLLLNGGGFDETSVAAIDLDQPDEVEFTLIGSIPGASGGIAVDAGGNVVTGVGWDPLDTRTGEVRIFPAALIRAHLDARSGVLFESDGLLLAPNVLSADSIVFDSDGRLFIGGGDVMGTSGQYGYAVQMESETVARVLAGGSPAEDSDLLRIQPDPCSNDDTTSVLAVAGLEMLLVSTNQASPPGACEDIDWSFGAPTYAIYFAPHAPDSDGDGIPDAIDPDYGIRVPAALREIAPLPAVQTLHGFSLTVDTADGSPRLGFMFLDPDYGDVVDPVLPRYSGVYNGNNVYVTERMEGSGWVAYNGRKTPQTYSHSELLVVDGTSFYSTNYSAFGGLISVIAAGPAIPEVDQGKGLYALTPAFTNRRAHSIAVFPGDSQIYLLAAQSGAAGFTLLTAPFSGIGDLGNTYVTKARFDDSVAADIYEPQLLVAGDTLIASYREGSSVFVRASALPGDIASEADIPVVGGCSDASLFRTASDGEYLYLACVDSSGSLTLKRAELRGLLTDAFEDVVIGSVTGVDALDLAGSRSGVSLGVRQGATVRVWDRVSDPAPVFQESVAGTFDLVRSSRGLVLSIADLSGDKTLRTFVAWPAD